MGLAASSEWATFDETVNTQLDISDVLSAILLVDDNFLAKFLPGKRATDVTHYWIEDALIPNSVTQLSTEAALSASATSLVVAANQGLRVRIGALLRDTAAGSNEVIQVTDISTDTLTITRGFGATDGVSHLAGATFRLIAQPKQEGADTQNSLTVTSSRVTNYTQIFERGIYLTGSYVQRPQVAIQDHVKWQVHKKVLELRREMSTAVYDSYTASSVGSDTVYRTFSGIRELITGATSPNTRTTSESVSPDLIEDLIQLIWDDGGEPTACIGRIQQIRKVANFYRDQVRYAPSDRIRGSMVNKFLSGQGIELELSANHWVAPHELAILDMRKVFLVPFRDLAVVPIAPTGDAKKWQVIGEYSLELRNRAEAHAMHTNLTV